MSERTTDTMHPCPEPSSVLPSLRPTILSGSQSWEDLLRECLMTDGHSKLTESAQMVRAMQVLSFTARVVVRHGLLDIPDWLRTPWQKNLVHHFAALATDLSEKLVEDRGAEKRVHELIRIQHRRNSDGKR